jgi:hypothetical protein
VELLTQIAPNVTRAAVLRDPSQGSGAAQFAAIATAAPLLKVDVSPVNMRDAGEIERTVAAFARPSNGGLITTAAAAANVYRDLIKLAARHKLPASFTSDPLSLPAAASGDFCRPIPDAPHVNRILKGRSRRYAGAGTDEIRNGHQSQNGEGTRPDCATFAASRQRGD